MAITYDAGQPYEIDPVSLRVITPIGKHSDWKTALPNFIGETNLLEATVTAVDGQRLTCALAGGSALQALAAGAVTQGQKGVISIRPEHLRLSQDQPTGGLTLEGRVLDIVYIGTDSQVSVQLAQGPVVRVRQQNSKAGQETLAVETPVYVAMGGDEARFLTD